MKMVRCSGAVFSALVATALAWPGAAGGQGASSFPTLDQVQLVRLGNGLQLLLAPDPRALAVDVAVWPAAGLRNETAGASGISHLFEHWRFEGSKGYGPREHLRLLQSDGGDVGAFTGADYSCFYQTVSPAAIETVFRLEADRMASLTLSQDQLQGLKRAIRVERDAAGRQNPLATPIQRLRSLAFGRHAYARPIMGLEADVEKLTLRQCVAYHRARYGPATTLVTVVGNFDPTEVSALARKLLEPIGPRVAAPPAAQSSGPQSTVATTGTATREARTGRRRVRVRANVPTPLFILGWSGPGLAEQERTTFQVLRMLLSGGSSAALPSALVGGGDGFLRVESGYEARRDESLYYVISALAPDADSAQVEQRLTTALEQIAAVPIPEAELSRARRQAEAEIVYRMRGVHGMAQALAGAQLDLGDYKHLRGDLERIRSCTADEIQALARKRLTAAQSVGVWVSPETGAARPGSPSTRGEGRP